MVREYSTILVLCCVMLTASSLTHAQTLGPLPPSTDSTLATDQAPTATLKPIDSKAAGTPLGAGFVQAGTDAQGRQSTDSKSNVASQVGEPLSVVLSLLGVIALILGLAALTKRFARTRSGLISAIGPGGRSPSGVLEVMGRYPVARGATFIVLRMDRRVLLLAQTNGGKLGGTQFTTLCETTDPEEVASLLVKTRDEEGDSIAKHFQSMLGQSDHDFAQQTAPSLNSHIATPSIPSDTTPAVTPAVDILRHRIESLEYSGRHK